jgi:hypothetical protein
VGNLQPRLAQVPTFIEQAVMSADPEEEGVLLSELEDLLNNPPIRPDLGQMVAMNVDADLQLIKESIPPSPISGKQVEEIVTNSRLLKSKGIEFEPQEHNIWLLHFEKKSYRITFYLDIFDEYPSLRLMTIGEPLLEQLLLDTWQEKRKEAIVKLEKD